MEQEILSSFLEKKVIDAKEEIKQKGILSENNALYLIINFLFNHVSNLIKKVDNLEKNMATKDDIKNMAKEKDVKKNEESIKDIINRMATKDDIKRLEEHIRRVEEYTKRVENYIKRLEYTVMFGIGILALVIALLQIFVK